MNDIKEDKPIIAEFSRGKYWSTRIQYDTQGILLADLMSPEADQQLIQGIVPIHYEDIDSVIAILTALANAHRLDLYVHVLVRVEKDEYEGSLGIVKQISKDDENFVDVIMLYHPTDQYSDHVINEVVSINKDHLVEINKLNTMRG